MKITNGPDGSEAVSRIFNILIVDDEKDVLDALYWTIKRNKSSN